MNFGRCDDATTTDLGVGVVGPTFTLDARGEGGGADRSTLTKL